MKKTEKYEINPEAGDVVIWFDAKTNFPELGIIESVHNDVVSLEYGNIPQTIDFPFPVTKTKIYPIKLIKVIEPKAFEIDSITFWFDPLGEPPNEVNDTCTFYGDSKI